MGLDDSEQSVDEGKPRFPELHFDPPKFSYQRHGKMLTSFQKQPSTLPVNITGMVPRGKLHSTKQNDEMWVKISTPGKSGQKVLKRTDMFLLMFIIYLVLYNS